MRSCRGDVRSEERSEILACGSSEIPLRGAKLTAYAVSEIAASGSSDRVPQPLRAAILFHYRRSGGNFAIHSVNNFAHGSSHEFRCPSGQFRVRACPHIFPRQLPIYLPMCLFLLFSYLSNAIAGFPYMGVPRVALHHRPNRYRPLCGLISCGGGRRVPRVPAG